MTGDGLTADIRAAAVPRLTLFRCQEPDPVFFRPVLQEFQNLSQGLVAGFNRVIIDSCASRLLLTASIRSTIFLFIYIIAMTDFNDRYDDSLVLNFC